MRCGVSTTAAVSARGRGNAVGLTSILDQGQFYSYSLPVSPRHSTVYARVAAERSSLERGQLQKCAIQVFADRSVFLLLKQQLVCMTTIINTP